MHTLDTYDLVLNFIAVVMMPIIIWANLRKVGSQNTMNARLWREHPNFMRACAVSIALLTAFSAVSLLGHFGLVPGQVVDIALAATGLLFLAVSVAMIWFGAGAIRMMAREWRGGGKAT